MRKILYLLILVQSIAFGQKIEFDIHNTTLNQYIQNELKQGSKQIPITSNHVSFNGEAQPIQFLKKNKIIPDLITYYFFKEKDSTMSYILYEWDVYNFEKQDNNQKSKKFQNALIKKYKNLKKEISSTFGEPIVKKNYSNISKLDSINTFIESSNWNPNDSTELELYTTVSNYYEKEAFRTINPTHRIRLYIRNLKKEKIIEPILDEPRILNLQASSISFINELKTNDFVKAKSFLSATIKNQVSDEKLQILSDNISINKEIELYYTGIHKEFNGKLYSLLQFKYSDDKSEVPVEIINFLFDDDNKIIGIQPLKKQ